MFNPKSKNGLFLPILMEEEEVGENLKIFLKAMPELDLFLENGDNDSAIQIRRLSGLKANMASKDKLQPSDYGTMSQSCQSVPPLNLDEEYYDADDLNQEMS